MDTTNAALETVANTSARLAHEMIIPGPIEPSGLLERERTLEALRKGEVLVTMEAAGVSYAEVQMLRRKYPGQPAFPFVPGYDLVGRVAAVGPGVDGALEGKRVATITGFGSWADVVRVPAQSLVVVPEGLDAAELDALLVNGTTAYKMLHREAKVRAGQTVVVLGAGGGVGTLLVQLARIAGVNVIGTCREAQRETVEALGATVLDYTRDDVLASVRALAPEGVAAVFDHVGGESLRSSYAMLAPHGVLVSYGNAAALKNDGSLWWTFLDFLKMKIWWSLLPGGRRATFFDLWGRGTFGADVWLRPAHFWQVFREDLGAMIELLQSGALQPHVARRVPLGQAGSALEEHRRGGVIGKIVLVADGLGA